MQSLVFSLFIDIAYCIGYSQIFLKMVNLNQLLLSYTFILKQIFLKVI